MKDRFTHLTVFLYSILVTSCSSNKFLGSTKQNKFTNHAQIMTDKTSDAKTTSNSNRFVLDLSSFSSPKAFIETIQQDKFEALWENLLETTTDEILTDFYQTKDNIPTDTTSVFGSEFDFSQSAILQMEEYLIELTDRFSNIREMLLITGTNSRFDLQTDNLEKNLDSVSVYLNRLKLNSANAEIATLGTNYEIKPVNLLDINDPKIEQDRKAREEWEARQNQDPSKRDLSWKDDMKESVKAGLVSAGCAAARVVIGYVEGALADPVAAVEEVGEAVIHYGPAAALVQGGIGITGVCAGAAAVYAGGMAGAGQ